LERVLRANRCFLEGKRKVVLTMPGRDKARAVVKSNNAGVRRGTMAQLIRFEKVKFAEKSAQRRRGHGHRRAEKANLRLRELEGKKRFWEEKKGAIVGRSFQKRLTEEKGHATKTVLGKNQGGKNFPYDHVGEKRNRAHVWKEAGEGVDG